MYFRAERKDRPFGEGDIIIPENYSGSAFGGGLIAQDDAEKLLKDEKIETCMPNDEVFEKTSKESEHADEKGSVSCSIPSHINARREGRKSIGESLSNLADSFLGSEELLIIGIILLIYNGSLDEDVLTLLILLLL